MSPENKQKLIIQFGGVLRPKTTAKSMDYWTIELIRSFGTILGQETSHFGPK